MTAFTSPPYVLLFFFFNFPCMKHDRYFLGGPLEAQKEAEKVVVTDTD